MLFPDSFEMQVNNYSVKQLEPIHRQSSLKYRKDEAFNVDLKHLQLGENKVTMLEKHASRDLKDVRIEADYHVIGLFIVEEKRVEQLVQEIVQTAMTSKEESTELLDSCFIHSK